MNEEIVAALERERLGGMPRWNLCPAWVDDAKRLLAAKDNGVVTALLSLDETAPAGNQGLTTVDLQGVA